MSDENLLREAHRRDDGKFGARPSAESSLSLEEPQQAYPYTDDEEAYEREFRASGVFGEFGEDYDHDGLRRDLVESKLMPSGQLRYGPATEDPDEIRRLLEWHELNRDEADIERMARLRTEAGETVDEDSFAQNLDEARADNELALGLDPAQGTGDEATRISAAQFSDVWERARIR